MALILHLETASKNCSVSLARDGVLLGIRELAAEKYAHNEQLHVLISELMDAHQRSLSQLSAVAVSKGPGSYTGLRIGVAAAKGLCYALDIPLIAVHTLAVLARAASGIEDRDALIVPMLDARRAEVYTQLYSRDFTAVTETKALVLQADSFSEFPQPLYCLGDGAVKARDIIQRRQTHFLSVQYPSAAHMIGLAYTRFLEREYEDLAYFEPYYLKDFLGTPPRGRRC